MAENFMERFRLYRDMIEDTDDDVSPEYFEEICTINHGIDFNQIRRFLKMPSTKPYLVFAPWTEKHLEILYQNPKLFRELCILNFDDIMKLVIAFGIWTEVKNYKRNYFTEDDEPILGGEIKDLIESRIDISKDPKVCITKGATISFFKLLLDEIEFNKSLLSPKELEKLKKSKLLLTDQGSYITIAVRNWNIEIITYLIKFGEKITLEHLIIAEKSFNNGKFLSNYLSIDRSTPMPE